MRKYSVVYLPERLPRTVCYNTRTSRSVTLYMLAISIIRFKYQLMNFIIYTSYLLTTNHPKIFSQNLLFINICNQNKCRPRALTFQLILCKVDALCYIKFMMFLERVFNKHHENTTIMQNLTRDIHNRYPISITLHQQCIYSTHHQ